MKHLTIAMALLFCLVLPAVAFADNVWVEGYRRADGTYVEPHYRSAPNGSRYDNSSTYGDSSHTDGARGTRYPEYPGASTDPNPQIEPYSRPSRYPTQ